jgi:transposase
MRGLIADLYDDWTALDERIETITGEIDQIGEKEANCRRLTSVPGIGPLISTAVVAAIGTGEAFERGRDFGAWLGLVPRQYSTGGRSILVASPSDGASILRTLFIQAANVILMRPNNWERFSFGAWLLKAAPRLHRNKLATALANKLARIAWSILPNEKIFDAHRHEVMAI